MEELKRTILEDRIVYDCGSDKLKERKDFLDLAVKIVSDPLFTLKQIEIKDDGDKDCWDRYEKYFSDKESFFSEYKKISSIPFCHITIKGNFNQTAFRVFLHADKKLVRFSDRIKFNYTEYFESLGY